MAAPEGRSVLDETFWRIFQLGADEVELFRKVARVDFQLNW